jgi:predicted dehydrogenase
MSEPIRVGVLGLTHDHVWDNLKQLAAAKGAEIAGAADPNEELRERVQREYGCPVHEDYLEFLDQTDLDAVYVFGNNAEGALLGSAAAGAGLHVLIEKPLASDLEGANVLLATARRAGVTLMVNWPIAWWSPLVHALDLARQGEIGEIWQVKYRAAHAGPTEEGCSEYFCDWLYDTTLNGGGALMDYCGYGALLSRVLMGMPSRVTGVAGRYCTETLLAEDNAVLAMEYARGLSLAEASWTQIGKMTSYVTAIYGDRGTLLAEPLDSGRLLLATKEAPEGRVVEVPPLPAHAANSAAHFLHCIQTGEEPMPLCHASLSRDAQEIVEAGQISVAEQKAISLPLNPQ